MKNEHNKLKALLDLVNGGNDPIYRDNLRLQNDGAFI